MTSKHLKRGYYLNKTSNFTSSFASTKMIWGGSWVLIQSWIRFDDLQMQLILTETFFILQKKSKFIKIAEYILIFSAILIKLFFLENEEGLCQN